MPGGYDNSGWGWRGGNADSASNPGRRGYTAGWFALELDNQPVPVGFVTQFDGGHFHGQAGDKAIENPDGMGNRSMYAGKPKYEDITIGIGMPNSKRLFQWVQSAVNNRPERHSGAIVGFDNFASQRERSRRIFYDALIREITFPGLDASSNQPANIIVKIAPEILRYERGTQTFSPQQARDEALKQKRWSCSNFGFRLDGFWDGGAKRNARIESFSIRQEIMRNSAGNRLEDTKEPGQLEYPNLVVSFGEEHTEDWMKWYNDTLLKGNTERRSGAITWYAPNLTDELMRLELDGISLLNIQIDRYEAGKEKIARAKATLCVENMTLVAGAGNV